MYVCTCVYLYVCMYVCLVAKPQRGTTAPGRTVNYVCMYASVHVYLYRCMCALVSTTRLVTVEVRMYVCVNVHRCMYVCLSTVCIYKYISVYVCVCLDVL